MHDAAADVFLPGLEFYLFILHYHKVQLSYVYLWRELTFNFFTVLWVSVYIITDSGNINIAIDYFFMYK